MKMRRRVYINSTGKGGAVTCAAVSWVSAVSLAVVACSIKKNKNKTGRKDEC